MSEHLNSLSLEYVESLLADYQSDPGSIPEHWRSYFDRQPGNGGAERLRIGPSLPPSRLFGEVGGPPLELQSEAARLLQHKVDQMVRTFRIYGHMAAQLDPIHRSSFPDELRPEAFGLSSVDAAQTVSTASLPGPDHQTVAELYERMRNTYCRSIGAEFMHIDDLAARAWLQQRMEGTLNRIDLPRDTQIRILKRLTAATLLETFIQKKYLGAKSFSLEGGETLIPLLDLAIEKLGGQGVREVVLGMAHRGRLNVLCNILGKSASAIFREFEDTDPDEYWGRGDVKYHLGYSSDWTTAGGDTVHVSMCFNPSHLEFINPVALGRTRAKQDRFEDLDRRHATTILVHGDAALAGEGIVQETLNLSELTGYRVGGTLHVVINNQIGFTTSPRQSRSNRYATDIAKMLQIPVLHVNGEDPEAVAQAVDVALDFRTRFQRDVVIDLYCYRRRGHNEGDEPAFTQPGLYREIRKRKPVRDHYLERLLSLGGVTREVAAELGQTEEERLENALAGAREAEEKERPQAYEGLWSGYVGGDDSAVPEQSTGIGVELARSLLTDLTTVPPSFDPHPKIDRILEFRREMASGRRALDWAAAEALAFASLLREGVDLRMSGQDCERGTFSHRHAVLHDVNTGAEHSIFSGIASQCRAEITNSPLSEAGVLGFEYGYSLDSPDALVIWEAQFGDFCNAAQVIIDQFITSAEDKWNRLSGLVLLLPHGFEGQGPEHSSARLERWLALAAEDNIQVVYPTTPAQYFHLLRRQVLRPWRKPLVVMTPKSLLRHPEVVSDLDAFELGTFRRVIPDEQAEQRPEAIDRILLCSGKVYYDLVAHSHAAERSDVAIVRLEQLYPLRQSELEQALAPYPEAAEMVWVQEEPRNMGAWAFLRTHYSCELAGRPLVRGIYRPESASPATGSHLTHKLEQDQLVREAFAS